MDTVAIAVGVGFTANTTLMKAVEFTGVENQVAALASENRSLLSKALLLVVHLLTESSQKCVIAWFLERVVWQLASSPMNLSAASAAIQHPFVSSLRSNKEPWRGYLAGGCEGDPPY
jgi:hypothetical protein